MAFVDPPFHNNPPPFRATGQGWMNRVPNLVATANNATGRFSIVGSNQAVYLFVTDVETGWTLTGDTGQSKAHRTFYPKNLHQDELAIKGITANQYEYDRIVQFVLAHQHKVIQNAVNVMEFRLYPYRILTNPTADGRLPRNPQYRWVTRPMQVRGVVENIKAGAERFKNVRTWEVRLKVTDDLLQKQVAVEVDLNAVIKKEYEKIFGAQYTQPQSKDSESGTPVPFTPPAQFDDVTEATIWNRNPSDPSFWGK